MLLYLPAAHAVHAAAPGVENEPAPHAVHTLDTVAATTLLNLPALQIVHAVAAAKLLYFPAAHAEQAGAPAGSTEYEPAPHAVQTNDVVAAATLPNLPAPQKLQVEAAAVLL